MHIMLVLLASSTSDYMHLSPNGNIIDGSMHTDVDECATDNGGCAQTCTNTVGSFVCSCQSGYTLASNGLTCDGELLVLSTCM